MKLYLVQHGEAKPEVEDPARPLTEKGRKDVEQAAMVADRMRLKPSKIYHSGKIRAEQTADILAKYLKCPVEAASGLNPNDNVLGWTERIMEHKGDLLIVGHLPFLEKFVSLLLTGKETFRPLVFTYGAIICLERRDDGSWGIRWILTPEMASYLA